MRLTVRLETEALEAIREEAERLGVTNTDVVRSCIYEVLLNKKKEKVGVTTERLIRQGLLNEEVLEGVRKMHGPDASSKDSVAWYRARLRRDDSSVLTEREARLDRL